MTYRIGSVGLRVLERDVAEVALASSVFVGSQLDLAAGLIHRRLAKVPRYGGPPEHKTLREEVRDSVASLGRHQPVEFGNLAFAFAWKHVGLLSFMAASARTNDFKPRGLGGALPWIGG